VFSVFNKCTVILVVVISQILYNKIQMKNMLTRRKESDTYLATVRRHRWSKQITTKIDNLPLQLMKATVLAESYNNLPIFIVICLLQ
jgi:hypothetical protein